MNIGLICAPVWTIHSPLTGIALLQAHLRRRGHQTRVFDLHVSFARDYPLLNKFTAKISSHYPLRLASSFQNLHLFFSKALDEYCHRILAQNFQFACFTIFKQNIFASVYLAKKLKLLNPDISILFGGPGCGLPSLKKFIDESRCADHIMGGPADDAINQLIALVEGNNSTSKISVNSDDEPAPDFSGFQLKQYSSNQIPYSTTRGCYKRCAFCYDVVYWKRYRRKSAWKVVSDIQKLKEQYDSNNFFFTDSVMLGDIRNIELFCDQIIREKVAVTWHGQIRGGELNAIILNKMKKAGCVGISVGIESGSQKILDAMNKDATIFSLERTVQEAAALGIKVYGLFIVGYPGETWNDFKSTLDFIRRNRNNLYRIRISPLSILPGTTLHVEADKLGIRNKDSFAWHMRGNSLMTRCTRLIILKLYSLAIGKLMR